MAAGASATSICSSVKLVGPRSTSPQTNWIRNVRGWSETTSVGGSGSGGGGNRGLGTDASRRPAGDDQGYASPVSRIPVAIGLAFPAPRLSIGLVAKLTHERARGGVDPLDPFQLPKQPRKHVRSLWSRRRSAARDACPSDNGSLTQWFVRYSANRVEIKLTAAITIVRLPQEAEKRPRVENSQYSGGQTIGAATKLG